MAQCKSCNATLGPDDRFCGKCGTQTEIKARPVSPVGEEEVAPVKQTFAFEIGIYLVTVIASLAVSDYVFNVTEYRGNSFWVNYSCVALLVFCVVQFAFDRLQKRKPAIVEPFKRWSVRIASMCLGIWAMAAIGANSNALSDFLLTFYYDGKLLYLEWDLVGGLCATLAYAVFRRLVAGSPA